ncbi:MAG TPA: hypothetical protein VGH11_10160 [Jatrophihabitans sp.]
MLRYYVPASDRTRLATAAVFVGLVALTAGSSKPASRSDPFGLPTGRPISRADLGSHPEAGLSFPGSRLVKEVGSDQTAKPNGQEPDPAYLGAIFTAVTTPARLYAWYAQWLTTREYHPATYYRLTDQPWVGSDSGRGGPPPEPGLGMSASAMPAADKSRYEPHCGCIGSYVMLLDCVFVPVCGPPG